jgi:hypothetical protein
MDDLYLVLKKVMGFKPPGESHLSQLIHSSMPYLYKWRPDGGADIVRAWQEGEAYALQLWRYSLHCVTNELDVDNDPPSLEDHQALAVLYRTYVDNGHNHR